MILAFPKPNRKKEKRAKDRQRSKRRSAFHVAVFAAAGNQCENVYCMSILKRNVDRLAAHHIIKRSHKGPDTPENGLCLCPICHEKAERGYNTPKGDRITAMQFQLHILHALKDRPNFRHGAALDYLERRVF